MLQTPERERPRTLPLDSSGITKGSRDGYFVAWNQDWSVTSTRDWTWIETIQEDLGCRRQLYGESVELIDLFGRDALGLLLLESRPHVEALPSPTLPYRDCARLVAQHLSLNKSDLAKLFSISRPTLYSWISGDSEPREELHRQRLAFLGGVAQDLFRGNPRPLYNRFVYEPMPGESQSIFGALEVGTWDEDLLRGLFRKAESLTAQRDEHLGTTPRSPRDAQEQNLQDNLLSLGGL